jgi:hypothetical protein
MGETLCDRRCTAMRMSGFDLRATKTQLSPALGPRTHAADCIADEKVIHG